MFLCLNPKPKTLLLEGAPHHRKNIYIYIYIYVCLSIYLFFLIITIIIIVIIIIACGRCLVFRFARFLELYPWFKQRYDFISFLEGDL